MFRFFIGLLLLLSLGCSRVLDSSKNGCSIFIEGQKYNAASEFDHQNLGETIFEKITLQINDSTRVEILMDHFAVGVTTWEMYKSHPENIVFTLLCEYYGGLFYMPAEGNLEICIRNRNLITGKFNLILYDGASSCMYCEGTMIESYGDFMVTL